jgi:hypothetical protein
VVEMAMLSSNTAGRCNSQRLDHADDEVFAEHEDAGIISGISTRYINTVEAACPRGGGIGIPVHA